MVVYQTDDAGYYAFTTEADPDPKTPGNFLIPRGCVIVAPPTLGPHESAQWVNGVWIIIPDYRGTTYWLADRSKYTIVEYGISPPVDSFTIEPPKTLNELKIDKKRQIEIDRDVANIQDVVALGTTWQADARSQLLLSSAITLATAGLPLPTAWRDALNNDVTITDITQLLAIAGAMAVQTQTAYHTSWSRKLAVDNALTPTDVDLA